MSDKNGNSLRVWTDMESVLLAAILSWGIVLPFIVEIVDTPEWGIYLVPFFPLLTLFFRWQRV